MDLPDNFPTSMENIRLLNDITNLIYRSKQIHTELIDFLQYSATNDQVIISAFDRVYRKYTTSYGTRVNIINRKGTTVYKAYYKIDDGAHSSPHTDRYCSILITEIDSIDIINDIIYFGDIEIPVSNENALITKLKNNLVLLTNGLNMLGNIREYYGLE